MANRVHKSSTSTSGPRTAGSGRPPFGVLLVDDHPVVRMGIRALINDEADLTVCGEAESPSEALKVAGEASPDVALVDLSLGHSSGLELVKSFHAAHPALPVLVLSMHDERLFAERALRAGARGYIMKQQAGPELINAVRRVATGSIYLSSSMTDRMLTAAAGRRQGEPGLSPVERLTDREREVFMMIGEGLGTARIADGLNLSKKTVETHRAHIKEKLGLKSATELVRFAATWSGRI